MWIKLLPFSLAAALCLPGIPATAGNSLSPSGLGLNTPSGNLNLAPAGGAASIRGGAPAADRRGDGLLQKIVKQFDFAQADDTPADADDAQLKAIQQQAKRLREAAGQVSGAGLTDYAQADQWSDQSPVNIYDYGCPVVYPWCYTHRCGPPYNPGNTSVNGWQWHQPTGPV
jgi:hypothetical protein